MVPIDRPPGGSRDRDPHRRSRVTLAQASAPRACGRGRDADGAPRACCRRWTATRSPPLDRRAAAAQRGRPVPGPREPPRVRRVGARRRPRRCPGLVRGPRPGPARRRRGAAHGRGRGAARGRPAKWRTAWLVRPGTPEPHDLDLQWLAAARTAFGMHGRALDGFYVITRTGWRDVLTDETPGLEAAAALSRLTPRCAPARWCASARGTRSGCCAARRAGRRRPR